MSGGGKKRRILVVDDHPRLLRFVEIHLKLCGFEVVTATSGKEALELAQSGGADIMLLDIIMPEMDGFEVLRRLRVFSQMPVIAFSASPANYETAQQLGANGFMGKPFSPEEMTRKIRTLLALRN